MRRRAHFQTTEEDSADVDLFEQEVPWKTLDIVVLNSNLTYYVTLGNFYDFSFLQFFSSVKA